MGKLEDWERLTYVERKLEDWERLTYEVGKLEDWRLLTMKWDNWWIGGG